MTAIDRGKRNNRTAGFISLVMIIMLAVIVSACSSSKQDGNGTANEADVKVDFSTNPAVVHTGKSVTLQSVVTGLPTLEGAQFAFDIRKSDWKRLPELINAKLDDKTETFVADTTFTEPGRYYVYLHLYQGELHITKKKEIMVE
ncbi:hypothetical protein [Paenibacillus kobensis]|uniref:hypothetical protein n=1 Tax=Paenibacillus kobensis TaxID=59841 RepID=UPI000FDC2096|nr:hypothetical protein [Paenibacillus kobensis]